MHTIYMILLCIGLFALFLEIIGVEIKHKARPINLVAVGLFFWLLVAVIMLARAG